jgi:hypothetical protein
VWGARAEGRRVKFLYALVSSGALGWFAWELWPYVRPYIKQRLEDQQARLRRERQRLERERRDRDTDPE